MGDIRFPGLGINLKDVPEGFTLFGLDVKLYGLMIAIGLVGCFAVLLLYAKQKEVDTKFVDFCFYCAIASIVFGFVSASLFQGIYDKIQNPDSEFQLFGKLTFIGGLIGGVVFFLIIYVIVRRKFKDTLYRMMPIVASCVTIAHGFGRIGCFLAGCCHGKQTDSVFGVVFPGRAGGNPVHPTQLYEAIFLFALFAVVTYLAFKYTFQYNMSIYLICYGIFRFINEYFRGDSRGEFVGNLSPSQFWAIVMVVLGIGYIFVIKYDLFGKLRDLLDRNVKKNENAEKSEEIKAEEENQAKTEENVESVSEIQRTEE
jgi:phosphatidylglycerol:prolipoprotein diacylglycerol transferase